MMDRNGIFFPPPLLHGTVLDHHAIMRSDLSRRLLRWMFRRRNELLTCVIDHARSGYGYQLAIVPQRSSRSARTRIETFRSTFDVLLRHATIASELRELGWTLVAYTDSPLTPDQQPLIALAA